MNETVILRKAGSLGFSGAAFMDTKDLVIVPEYRKYCEMNLCHCYDVNPACPPQCGTVEELREKIRHFPRALILQTTYDNDFAGDPEGAKRAKRHHNELADRLMEQLPDFVQEQPQDGKKGTEEPVYLRMSSGPWKSFSCMSAYCVDAQKMADSVHMVCWAKDGKCRLFSQILFSDETYITVSGKTSAEEQI